MSAAEQETGTLREKLARKLAANPAIKTAMLAEALGVAEAEIFRNWPDDSVKEIEGARAEEIIRALEALGDLYVICRNGVCVMEVTGRFGEFSRSGPWFNVSTPSLHLHVRLGLVTSVFRVDREGKEPGSSSISIQFFDGKGESVLKAFLLEGKVVGEGRNYAELAALMPL